MDLEKKKALLQWASAISNSTIVSLNEVDLQFIHRLFKAIDTSIELDETDVFMTINDLFKPAHVCKEKVLCNDGLEIGKLLCLMLEFSLTCPNNDRVIEMIQQLDKDVQINIMSITKMVSENIQEVDFSKIVEDHLRKSVNPEELIHHPTTPTSSQKVDSPNLYAMVSPITAASPLSTMVSSPKAMMKVMMENKKLRQRIRQSEAFEESIYDSEKKKNRLMLQENDKLLRERNNLQLRIDTLEDSVSNYRNKIDSLNSSVEKKDGIISELKESLKEKCENLAHLQSTCNDATEMESEIQRLKKLLESENLKSKELNIALNQSEQLSIETRRKLCEEKEKNEKLNNEVTKLKKDNDDYVIQLENKINQLEKMAVVSKTEDKQECLSESIEREKAMTELQETVDELKKKLSIVENERQAYKASCMNIGSDLERERKLCTETQKSLDECRSQLKEMQVRHDKSVQTLTAQYMNQVSSLCSQVEQHSKQNHELHTRITKTEEEHRAMECKLKICEDKSREIQNQCESLKKSNNSELIDLRTQLQNIQQEKEFLQNELKIFKAIDVEFSNFKSEHAQTVEIKNQKISTLQNEIDQLKSETLGKIELEKTLNEQTEKLELYITRSSELEIFNKNLTKEAEEQDTKWSQINTQYEELQSLYKKLINENEELLQKNNKLNNLTNEIAEAEDLTNQIATLKNENSVYLEKSKELQSEIEVLKKKNQYESLMKNRLEKTLSEKEQNEIDLEEIISKLKKENDDLSAMVLQGEETNDLQEENRRLLESINSLMEKITMVERENSELKEGRREMETLVNDGALKNAETEELIAYYEHEKKQMAHDNERLNEKLEESQMAVDKLLDKIMDEQEQCKQLLTKNASLDAQLVSANNVILQLKKDLKASDTQYTQPTSNKIAHSTRIDDFSDLDSTFHLAEIESKPKTIADEIFHQRRKENASARRSMLLSTKYEETESSEDDNFSQITRTYSMRSNRRRSYQPRVYMGGRTPPGKRTAGNTMAVPLSSMTMDEASEPDLTNTWDVVSKLREELSNCNDDSPEEPDRVTELQRRNTLCLPHLKSSYPMELTVAEHRKPVVENELRGGSSMSGKRGLDEHERTLLDAPRGTFKKCKTENFLSWTEPVEHLTRSSRSDSVLKLHQAPPSPNFKEKRPKPQTSSIAFEIAVEPKKNVKPRFPRSNASGNLMKDRANIVNNHTNTVNKPADVSTYAKNKIDSAPVDRRKTFVKTNTTSKHTNPTSKSINSRNVATGKENENHSSFSRNSSRRSSFLKAKSKVTDSFKNRKLQSKVMPK